MPVPLPGPVRIFRKGIRIEKEPEEETSLQIEKMVLRWKRK
jgi:hypothetical protein